MNFTEAVKAMNEGKQARVTQHKDTLPWVYISPSFFIVNEDGTTTKETFNMIHYLSEWEIVDDDKDWNLTRALNKFKNIPNEWAHKDDVKKCRDLILEDIKEEILFSITRPDAQQKTEKIINKRFGDLK